MLTPFDQDTAMNDNPDSDPFDSETQAIKHSGPAGHFGLQLQAPAFVGRRTLQEYERDCPSKNDVVARPGGIKAVCHPSPTIF
jgi:hypothetical protein